MRGEPFRDGPGSDAAAHACAQHASIAASDARAYRWADADAYSYAYSRTVNAADIATHALACHPAWRSHRHACLRADA